MPKNLRFHKWSKHVVKVHFFVFFQKKLKALKPAYFKAFLRILRGKYSVL